jgi:hypothetical protein
MDEAWIPISSTSSPSTLATAVTPLKSSTDTITFIPALQYYDSSPLQQLFGTIQLSFYTIVPAIVCFFANLRSCLHHSTFATFTLTLVILPPHCNTLYSATTMYTHLCRATRHKSPPPHLHFLVVYLAIGTSPTTSTQKQHLQLFSLSHLLLSLCYLRGSPKLFFLIIQSSFLITVVYLSSTSIYSSASCCLVLVDDALFAKSVSRPALRKGVRIERDYLSHRLALPLTSS